MSDLLKITPAAHGKGGCTPTALQQQHSQGETQPNIICQAWDVQRLIARLKLLWPCWGPHHVPLSLTRDDGVADAPGTALVLVDRRDHPHGGTLGTERRHMLQPPRPSTAGATGLPTKASHLLTQAMC